jgi:hypothetical protein
LYLLAIVDNVELCLAATVAHRGHHDPFEPMQSVDVPGGQVVLDDAPVDRSVGGDDGLVVVVDPLGVVRVSRLRLR